MSQPAGPSQPDDAAERAAKAAFAREWKQLLADLGTKREDDDEEHERLVAFVDRAQFLWARHRRILEKNHIDVQSLIAEAEERLAEMRRAEAEAEKCEQTLLHTAAALAEARANLVERLLENLIYFETLSDEQWADMEWAQRENWRALMADLQERAPALLAQLPLERRHAIERRRPAGPDAD